MARGVRATAPSLSAPRLCAVCGGSEVARGVVFVGAERRRCGGRELWGALGRPLFSRKLQGKIERHLGGSIDMVVAHGDGGWFMRIYPTAPLGPSETVFGVVFLSLNSFSEGIWSTRAKHLANKGSTLG